MSYKVITRKQFTFITTDKKLACILTKNIKKENDCIIVNIVAMFIQKIESGDNFATIVVGPVDPNSNDDLSYEEQLEQFRKNLEIMGIEYHENQVLQIFNIENVIQLAGTFRIPIIVLTCAGIPVRNFYFGEPSNNNVISTFIDIPRRYIIKALEIIRNIDTDNISTLCINENTFAYKCLCEDNDKKDNICNCVCIDQEDF